MEDLSRMPINILLEFYQLTSRYAKLFYDIIDLIAKYTFQPFSYNMLCISSGNAQQASYIAYTYRYNLY